MPSKHEGDLDSYPGTYLTCRSKGHAWNDGDFHEVKEGRTLVGWDEHSKCLRCPATKVTEFDKDAYPLGRSKITYPDGYLFQKGHTHKKHESRRELISRRTGRARLAIVNRHV